MRSLRKCNSQCNRIRLYYFASAIVVLVALLSAPCLRAATGPSASANSSGRGAWMNRSLSPLRRADLLLRAMRLDEKIAMVHGVSPLPIAGYCGYVPPIARLSIPALRLANGRAGVGDGAGNVTLLPAPIAISASWDVAMMREFGTVLGNEEWRKGTNVTLGPTIDVVRVPQWGRTFETYGEDPYLNSQMAIAEIDGIQSQGPLADANMYLTMNQEENRLKENSVVDPRTLHEIYLAPFRAAVQQAHVGTFMCAYVKTNGVYSCENPYLLHRLLKGDLGFRGWVMSDWGATHSTIASANGGLDQQMPDATYYGKALKTAIENGQVSAATLDEHVRRILFSMFRQGLFDRPQPGTWSANVRTPEHDAFSRRAAEQGTVLLKNAHNILPLSDSETVAVIGADGGVHPKVEGLGSSAVVAPYIVSPVQGIRKRVAGKTRVSYADGSNFSQAAEIARAAQVAIVFVNTDETEGADRPNLELPNRQDQLIAAVATANPNTVVVLNTAGPVLMPWVNNVRAIIESWYSGQEDGSAIAAVLYGDVDPGGRLPLTFPATVAAIPTGTPAQWPGINGNSTYSEKLNVGYRWYYATHTAMLFPFGYGLSYTTFRLSRLSVTPEKIEWLSGSYPTVHARVSVTNTGKRYGTEVVQVYVQQPARNGEPPRQLRAFLKVALQPGQTRRVSMTLDEHSFAIYDPSAHTWEFPDGVYHVLAGTSSRDLPLHCEVTIKQGAPSHP